jgi:preprotein translocase subunit SecB
MKKYPLRLERYFFTEQQVNANPGFDQDDAVPSILDFFYNVQTVRIGGNDHEYGITAKVSLNHEQSQNPPYFFSISAFGIIAANEDIDAAAVESMIETTGAQMLLGAIRERLSDMTARGPWGPIYLDFVPLPLTTTNK